MPFRGVDYFGVDSLFTGQELLVRQTARRFAEERIVPLVRDCYREARFPSELIGEFAELGFLGSSYITVLQLNEGLANLEHQ